MQMFSSHDAFENDFCPVRDELLGEMYRANKNGLPQLVASVSSDVRAMLSLFCYRRSHLYSLALSIAASCSEQELAQFGGRAGTALYALSREPAARPGPATAPLPSLRRPQADHAAHQAALYLRAGRGRTRRRLRGLRQSGYRLTNSLGRTSSLRRVGNGGWAKRSEPTIAHQRNRYGGHGADAPLPTLRILKTKWLQSMPSPRHAAFDIAGHAGSAHLGTNRVNHATGRNSDPA